MYLNPFRRPVNSPSAASIKQENLPSTGSSVQIIKSVEPHVENGEKRKISVKKAFQAISFNGIKNKIKAARIEKRNKLERRSTLPQAATELLEFHSGYHDKAFTRDGALGVLQFTWNKTYKWGSKENRIRSTYIKANKQNKNAAQDFDNAVCLQVLAQHPDLLEAYNNLYNIPYQNPKARRRAMGALVKDMVKNERENNKKAPFFPIVVQIPQVQIPQTPVVAAIPVAEPSNNVFDVEQYNIANAMAKIDPKLYEVALAQPAKLPELEKERTTIKDISEKTGLRIDMNSSLEIFYRLYFTWGGDEQLVESRESLLYAQKKREYVSKREEGKDRFDAQMEFNQIARDEQFELLNEADPSLANWYKEKLELFEASFKYMEKKRDIYGAVKETIGDYFASKIIELTYPN